MGTRAKYSSKYHSYDRRNQFTGNIRLDKYPHWPHNTVHKTDKTMEWGGGKLRRSHLMWSSQVKSPRMRESTDGHRTKTSGEPKIGTGARCGDRHILDAFSPKVSIMCPKMWPNPTMCPNDSQNMSNLADYVQKASKLLTFFWTFVVQHTKHVQTARKCPKYVHNVSKLWTHWRLISSKRKVSKL